MAALNDIKMTALADQGFTTGTLNDRWMALLVDQGYTTGSLNERQIQSWADLGYGYENLLLETGDSLLLEDGGMLLLEGTPTTWNEMAAAFWTAGGSYGSSSSGSNFIFVMGL